jgi:uncharacterized protein (TIGR02147 family)
METSIQNAPRILDYLDFRVFLKDYVDFQKMHVRGFSLRTWTTKMGLSSASFWSAVLKGKKNLSEETRHKCAAVLNLQGPEEAFFHWLVQFNQAKDMEGKNYCFQQLQKFRGSRARVVGEGQYRFYSKWYYAAVWNYFGLRKGRADLRFIAEAMIPQITEDQVEEAIAVLVDLGLLHRKANHVFETSEMHLTTEPEISSLAVKNHIRDLHAIAAELLDTVPPQDRQYNTLMFQVSAQGFTTIKDRIRQFQEELRDILDHDKHEDRVYTLSMSLFPNLKVPLQ